MFTRFIVGGLSLALGLAFGAAARADQPKAGAAKKLAEVFQDLDANHDGVLDQAEVDAPSKPAFKTVLQEGDANKDGKIDSKEFDALGEKVIAARKAAAKAKAKAAAKKAPDDAKPADDARPAAKKKGGERIKTVVEKLRTNDADKDGRLSRDEFQGKPAAFDRLDADHNGYLDKADLKALRAKAKAAREKGEKSGAEKPADAS
ncbi:MAG: hypothetical protein BGO49_29625 [Planctomycetales bacterium 71-10]|nr:MAG: hypothetical protein BGO49_29625 [Planctomycetales bacterium 71-10]